MTRDAEIAELRDRYLNTFPFPHVVIDGALWDVPLVDVIAEFPPPDDPRWHTFDSPVEIGKQQMDGEAAWNVGPATIAVLDAMGRTQFVDVLERITGIDGLIPNIVGGGLHQTLYGGLLGMHTDSTVAFDSDLYRRVNVILFLNIGWVRDLGGALTLASDNVYGKIAPQFNRLVIFETTPTTWHGHPDPWRGPEPRRSLACYYYTEDPPPGFAGHKETTFRG